MQSGNGCGRRIGTGCSQTGKAERNCWLNLPQNCDGADVWGEKITKIFVGLDLASGFYMVEGSTMLWDELCAFQGLDERDLENFVRVGQYVQCLKRFGKTEGILDK